MASSSSRSANTQQALEAYLDEVQDWVALMMQTSISNSALPELIQDAEYSFKILHKTVSERDEEELYL
ncbi:hypothetical protein BDM02DRAFT_3121358, partial [Thelephora ganbajun]